MNLTLAVVYMPNAWYADEADKDNKNQIVTDIYKTLSKLKRQAQRRGSHLLIGGDFNTVIGEASVGDL